MIERFLFPQRTRLAKHSIDPMSSRTFEALKYVYERERPAIFIAQRLHEYVDVVGHDYDGMQLDPNWWLCGAGALAREVRDSAFSQTMREHEGSRLLWQSHPAERAERDEQIRIALLNMRKSAAVTVLREDWVCGHRCSCVGRAPSPPWNRIHSQNDSGQ